MKTNKSPTTARIGTAAISELVSCLHALDIDQLRALNDTVIFEIRRRQREAAENAVTQFKVGDVVAFVKGRTRHYVRIEGITAKNLKGVEVCAHDHKQLLLSSLSGLSMRWTMNPVMVSKVGG